MDERALHIAGMCAILGSFVALLVLYFALWFPFPAPSHPVPSTTPAELHAQREITQGQARIEREMLQIQKEIQERAEAQGG